MTLVKCQGWWRNASRLAIKQHLGSHSKIPCYWLDQLSLLWVHVGSVPHHQNKTITFYVIKKCHIHDMYSTNKAYSPKHVILSTTQAQVWLKSGALVSDQDLEHKLYAYWIVWIWYGLKRSTYNLIKKTVMAKGWKSSMMEGRKMEIEGAGDVWSEMKQSMTQQSSWSFSML